MKSGNKFEKDLVLSWREQFWSSLEIVKTKGWGHVVHDFWWGLSFPWIVGPPDAYDMVVKAKP